MTQQPPNFSRCLATDTEPRYPKPAGKHGCSKSCWWVGPVARRVPGSGCSAYDPKPSWQTDTGCTRRTVADVAAVADPNTGVAVYDSYSYQGSSGWLVFGGTSVAAPIIGAVYALAGNSNSVTYGSFPYSHPGALFDVTSGSNGACSGSYLCTGATGYDGPTGLGTPNGATAFSHPARAEARYLGIGRGALWPRGS